MSDQFVAEIRLVGFNFAPVGWALAAGQILPISQYTAVFSLVGTYYGGNGTSNFALPNLQGNVAIGQGQAPGLSSYVIGETGGSSTVTLLASEVPVHTHTFLADATLANQTSPTGNSFARTEGSNSIYAPSGGTKAQLNTAFISTYGGNQPHNNMMPYLTLNWVIALQGIFPSRS